jgi:hypothetical protein
MKITPNEASQFVEFLQSDRADRYFGRAWLLKSEVLQHVISGKPALCDIARRHDVSPAALSRYHRIARDIFGGMVDC